MGGASSTATSHASALGKTETEIVRLMMPIYYTTVEITPEERKAANESWNLILNNTAPEFEARRRTDADFKFESTVMFFYDIFYARLFDIHPLSKELFKRGMKAQGKFLVQMITLSLSERENPEKYNTTLTKLAEIHYHRGVKALEYGIVGEVLFWALRFVIGNETYTDTTHSAWVKIYSRMLRIIVPAAISWELQLGSAKIAAERIVETNKSTMLSMNSAAYTTSSNSHKTLRVPSIHGKAKGGVGGTVEDGEEDDDDHDKERIAKAEPVLKN